MSPSFHHVPPNISYSAVNFQEIAAERPTYLRESINSAFEIVVADERVKTAAPFPASQVVEAFKRVGSTNGPVVIKFDINDEIALTSDTQATTRLNTTVSVRATRMFAQRAESTNSAYTSPHDISTTMAPINDAIEYLDSLEPGASFCWTEVAKKFGVVRSTLTRRYTGILASRNTQERRQQKLTPHEETELV